MEKMETNMPQGRKSDNKWLDRIIVMAAVVIVIAAVAIFLGKKSGKKASIAALQQMEQIEPDYSFLLDNIEGSYDITLSDGETTQQGVARIKYNDIEGYDLIVYSEFRPVTYHFKSTEGAKLTSSQLGDGLISYEKDFEKITITFNKEN